MTPRQIILDQIAHRETDPVPCTLAFEGGVAERVDAHYGNADWRKRIIPYIAPCGGIAWPPNQRIDEAHHRDAFGTLWRTDKEAPVVIEPGLKKPSFDGYDFPKAQAFLNPQARQGVIDAVAANRDSFTYIHLFTCMWDAWYLRGFEETLMDCVAEEDFYAELLDRMCELTIEFINACEGIEADAIFMGDDWGIQRGILMGADRWRRFYKPRYARIFDAIHAQGKKAVVHCCGSTADIMGDICEIGLDVLESVQPEAAGMDPYALKKAWGDRITFWGCLGSQSTIPFATPDELVAEIRRLRIEMSKGGGFILAPAKPLRPETPTENLIALVEEFLRP
ncbi:MAG: hypothetical protein LLG01_01685 [Planctomycetaceae bacterium]|nr:hypothetical protein [Planctomycetaceae bacterium]